MVACWAWKSFRWISISIKEISMTEMFQFYYLPPLTVMMSIRRLSKIDIFGGSRLTTNKVSSYFIAITFEG
jgi:hypothetical protein